MLVCTIYNHINCRIQVMDKPHEYEHIEWINSNQSRIQLSLLPGINESLNNRKAKINIVSYLAEWCPNCHYEAITLKNIYNEFYKHDLEMILVMNYASMYKSKKFAERYELKMGMMLGELNKKNKNNVNEIAFTKFRNDVSDSRIWGTPFHIIIIQREINKIGIVKGEFIYKEIRELLSDHLVDIKLQ